jgi:signal transduction histidine kinase
VNSGSLRLRLLGAGVVAVAVVLAAAALGLSLLFERHVERRVLAELSAELDLLAAGVDFDQAGLLAVVRPPSDPRLSQPFSGYYWQVRIGDQVMRSRSLWDSELNTQDRSVPGTLSSYRTDGPAAGERLTVAERVVILPDRLGKAEARIAVAIDRNEITAATTAFRADLLPYLGLVGALILAAGFAQVTVGLRPLAAVRRRLAAIKGGKSERLGKGYPQEVQPLVDEVDALLDASDAAVDRARFRASDLAHALKTPLQILAGDIDRLRSKGDLETAENIAVVAAAMRRVAEHELARTRAVHGGPRKSVDVAAVVDQVLNVIQRTPQGDRLVWTTEVDPNLTVRLDDESLTEALGNVLENAARHAKQAVTIKATSNARTVSIDIVDDGDGIAADRLHDVLKRGVRLDEKGSGLGLAIVAEIAAAHGGKVELENRNPGLAVRLEFPKADQPERDD